MLDTKKYDIEIVINKKLKHSYISITRDKKVVVKTPYSSQSFIDNLLASKAVWIEQKLQKITTSKPLESTLLHSIESVQSRVEHFSKLMGLSYSELKFRKMKRRWGSCTSKGVITLNKELLRLEQELVDYVVVHELAHLKHMNHSKMFHNCVTSYLPDARKREKELQNIRIVST